MNGPLYRERLYGQAPRVHDSLPTNTKRGLIAVVTTALKSDGLAADFPLRCDDGNGICGTDNAAAIAVLESTIPDLSWPPDEDVRDGVVFDLIEFFAARIATPKKAHWHNFFNHYELELDQPAGYDAFATDVNAILSAG